MHSKNVTAFISFGLKTLSIAVASVVLSSASHAAGLGKLTVLSSLGQPLRAEIELSSATQEEAESLVAKLAPAEAFRQAKIPFNPVLSSIRFTIEHRGGRHILNMTSVQPVNEPFIDVLLELAGNKGRLIREYTFLLDPIDLRLSQAAQEVAPIAVPAVVERKLAAPVAAVPADENRQSVDGSVAKERPKPVPRTQSASYRVRNGDTLTMVAAKFKPEGVSLDQMLVALYQANPKGFIGNNMNRMRAGIVLAVPDNNAASTVTPSGASAVVVTQAADFNAYRNQLAGKVARAAPQSAQVSTHSATGKIETQVEEAQATPAQSKDTLKLSKADAISGNAAGLASAAVVGHENRIAADKAIEEATARIKNLEKNINDLQKLLEIKNQALSEQQHNAQTPLVNAAAPSAPESNTAAHNVAPVPAAAISPVPAVAKNPPTPSLSVKADGTAVKPATNTSFFDELLNNPLLLPAAGILIALLGALGIYSNRRRKKPYNKFDDSAFAAQHLQANSLFGSTGGQSVDTNNSVFNSSFSPSASHLDANEVDPVAEADVYIAYGRDAQAEEILKEALRTQPDRHPVRLKLLEIYASRKDLRSFEMLASEMYGMTKGETDEWHQASRLGAVLDPNNPLYAGGAVSEEIAAGTTALGAPTLPLEELDPEALLTNSLSHTDGERKGFGFDNDALMLPNGLSSTAPIDSDPNFLAEAQNSISHGLDFDLDEIASLDAKSGTSSLQQADAHNMDFVTVTKTDAAIDSTTQSANPMFDMAPDAAPIPSIPKFDLGEVDFDFLDSRAIAKADANQHTQLQVIDAAPVESATMAANEVGKNVEVDDAPMEAPAEHPVRLECNLPEIDLDFNPADTSNALTKSEFASTAHFGDVFGDAELSTKLDLAIAYQEIGDKEGARELLDEVVKDGSLEQVQKAKNMLAELN